MPVTIRRQELIAAVMAARRARVSTILSPSGVQVSTAEDEMSSCRGHFLPQSSSGFALPWPGNVT